MSESFKCIINEQEVTPAVFSRDFRDGVHKVYRDGILDLYQTYLDGELHGRIGKEDNFQVWYRGRQVGRFKDVLKEKGRLWFATMFGRDPQDMARLSKEKRRSNNDGKV